MKKLLIALLLVVPAVASAQNYESTEASQEVRVTASINSALTLTKVQDLLFGNFDEGGALSSATLPANPATAFTNVDASAQRAILDVEGTSGAKIAFTVKSDNFDDEGNLLLLVDGGSLAVDEDVLIVELLYHFQAGTTLNAGSAYTIGEEVTLTDGEGRLNIGGIITFVADQEDGIYRADITVGVAYY